MGPHELCTGSCGPVDDPNMGAAEMAVYFVLMRYAAMGNGAQCFPSIRTIASHTGQSTRTVQRALKRLAAYDHISRTARVRRGTKAYTSSLYTLKGVVPRTTGNQLGVVPRTTGGDTRTTPSTGNLWSSCHPKTLYTNYREIESTPGGFEAASDKPWLEEFRGETEKQAKERLRTIIQYAQRRGMTFEHYLRNTNKTQEQFLEELGLSDYDLQEALI